MHQTRLSVKNFKENSRKIMCLLDFIDKTKVYRFDKYF